MAFLTGRIIKGVGGLYTVSTAEGAFSCKARGIFRNKNITPLIGDFVEISIDDEQEKTAVINTIHQRKNELRRPRIANVDHGVLVFAAVSPDLNKDLLDRLVLLCQREGLKITICINKCDLTKIEDLLPIAALYENVGYPVLFTSNDQKLGIEALKSQMQNQVTVFAGPSGAGKSSLINQILPGVNMAVGALSEKIARGKHTTRHTELLTLSENSFVADTPGFTSMDLTHIPKEDLEDLFIEFKPWRFSCRFRNCRHIDEPGCAIKLNVEKGNIAKARYERYVLLYRELS